MPANNPLLIFPNSVVISPDGNRAYFVNDYIGNDGIGTRERDEADAQLDQFLQRQHKIGK